MSDFPERLIALQPFWGTWVLDSFIGECMAPEVCLGKGKYDATVNLNSLGLGMHRWLNRQRFPFLPTDDAVPTHTERNAALETRLRGTPIPQPLDGGADLAKVICKACVFDPHKRYHTAEENLSSKNAMGSANSSYARTLRQVNCLKNSGMTLRHAAAGFLEAERSIRRVRGYKQIPVLISSLTLLTVTADASILNSA